MLLIKNGKILTMAGTTYEEGSILIEGTKIVQVGTDLKIDEDYDIEVIDATNLLVMPGLIESHCHLGIIEEKKGVEGDDCNESTSPITPYLRAIDAINTMDSAFHDAIMAGITSIMVGPGSSNVVGGQFAFIKTRGRVIDDLVVLAPAAMKAAFGENPKSCYSAKGKSPTTRMAIVSLLREEFFHATRYKNCKERAKSVNEDFDIDFRLEPWIPVLEKKIPLKVHVHRTDDIQSAIRVAKEFDINLTLDHCSEGHLIVDIIKKSGFPCIIGPGLTSRNKIEIQYADFKTAGILANVGVKVAITTDHPVCLVQYLALSAGLAVKAGLSMEEGLKAITINPAEICNVADRVGSIEVGKDADIAIFDGNPMEIFTKTKYTIIDGEIVYREKELVNNE